MAKSNRRIRGFLGLVFIAIITVHFLIVTLKLPFLSVDLITVIIKPEIRNCIGIFKENGQREKTDFIIIHHDSISKVTNNILAIHDYHVSKGFGTIAYHYYIDKNGVVFQLHDENSISPHARQYNSNSVGICLNGNFEIDSLYGRQELNLKRLIFYLKLKYKNAKIVGHKELLQTKCPGKNINLDKIRADVETYYIYPL